MFHKHICKFDAIWTFQFTTALLMSMQLYQIARRDIVIYCKFCYMMQIFPIMKYVIYETFQV